MEDLKHYIRSVPDFPKKGINFYDISTLMASPQGMTLALARMEEYVRGRQAQKIVAIESRGFIFGGILADRLKVGLVPARKPGKLPYKTVSASYALEYGVDTLEMHVDAVTQNERVVVVDDLIATGGTLAAVCQLCEELGGIVVGVSAIIELSFLPWREKLSRWDVNTLISFDTE
jgi:adenine phosphoribosyltransferase